MQDHTMTVTRTRWVTPAVYQHTRRGRRKPELTCTCGAVPWPHRAGSVPDCTGLAYCLHGVPTREHPDWDGRCPRCDLEEWADYMVDLRRGT